MAGLARPFLFLNPYSFPLGGAEDGGWGHWLAVRVSTAKPGRLRRWNPGFLNATKSARSIHAAEAVVQGIAGAAHGADRIGSVTAVDRLAQAADMDVDGAL